MKVIRLILIVSQLILMFTVANATIIHIPGDYSTIQTGINTASDGDTVLVQPGTYVENINYNGKNITVGSLFLTTQDTSYISQTIIDGNQNSSVVRFWNGEDSTAVLCGFTITNGICSTGGGVICNNANPKILNNHICNNFTDYLIGVFEGGAGIYCISSSPIIKNNRIYNNNVEWGYGGGICCWSSSPEIINNHIYSNHSNQNNFYGGGISCMDSSNALIKDCLITNNSSNYGGGIYYSDNPSGSVENSIITNNQANLYGGGICFKENSNPILIDVTISNNECSNDSELNKGGGIYCNNSSPTFIANSIIDNECWWDGGGLFCENNSDITITLSNIKNNYSANGAGLYCSNSNLYLGNCIIENSDAFSYGGAFYLTNNSVVEMDSVSILANVASVGGGINSHNSTVNMNRTYLYNNGACDGGAIISYNSNINIYCSIFCENGTYSGGSAIDANNGSEILGCNITITDNYAQTNCGGITCDSNSNVNLFNTIMWNDTPPEISGSSVVVNYSDIQGGWAGTGNIDADPLFVDPENGDYHLSWANFPIPDSTKSPCIDTGTPDTTGLNLLPWDLDGNPRIVNCRIDMGAYEWQGLVGIDDWYDSNLKKIFCQNYPNPFSASTTISFNSATNKHEFIPLDNKHLMGQARINIYNIKGELIKQLSILNSKSSIVWDGKDKNGRELPNGIYLYQLKYGNQSITKKMILLR